MRACWEWQQVGIPAMHQSAMGVQRTYRLMAQPSATVTLDDEAKQQGARVHEGNIAGARHSLYGVTCMTPLLLHIFFAAESAVAAGTLHSKLRSPRPSWMRRGKRWQLLTLGATMAPSCLRVAAHEQHAGAAGQRGHFKEQEEGLGHTRAQDGTSTGTGRWRQAPSAALHCLGKCPLSRSMQRVVENSHASAGTAHADGRTCAQDAAAVGAGRPMQHRAAGEVAAQAQQLGASKELQPLAWPPIWCCQLIAFATSGTTGSL